MTIALELDEKLLEEARRSGGHSTADAAVSQALAEYVRRHKRQSIVELFGTIEYDDDFDYKAARMPAGGAAGLL